MSAGAGTGGAGAQGARGSPGRACTALVLSGGGARGAYQVGVLRGLIELGVVPAQGPGFELVVGSSAGAIHSAMLAAHADRLGEGVERLERLWSGIEAQQVFRTDLRSLGGIGIRWVRDLSFGGVLGRVAPKALLDTAPLRELLGAIPFEGIDAQLAEGSLRALAIAATDLHSAQGVLFVHGGPELPLWHRSRWRVEHARIGREHVMASSAIPIFFPSVEIEGRHYGDGCIRNTTPLSPAIHLGAQRILAIGVRDPGSEFVVGSAAPGPPTVAQIAGVLLDAVLLDAIEVDVEHSERVNRSVIASRARDPENPFRWVDVLSLRPSTPIAAIARELSHRIPRVVRYLMRGLGTDEATTELSSYLLFDAAFCTRLMELGRADVRAAQGEVLRFFEGAQQGPRAA